MTTPRFTLLIPIKDGREAKTRLDAVGAVGRADLMAAFARDAVTAALRTPLVRVHVVGDRAALEPVLAGLDVTVVPDEGGGDLNLALTHAAHAVADPARGTAVMLADLPCLRSEDLEAALAAAPTDHRSFVADAAGTGTTLLVAPPGTTLDPRFGHDSARAHADSGAAPITADLASLRLDVDTSADLERALQFGVGPHTRAAAAGLGHLAGS